MITLNLISPDQKEANRFQKNFQLAKEIILILIVALVISIVILWGTKTLLQNKLSLLVETTQNLTRQTEKEKRVDLEQTVKDFNKLLNNIANLQKEYTPWSTILIKSTAFIPSGIKLTSWQLNKDRAEFRFSGLAKTRQDILTFKETLEKSDLFTDIQSPISNILSKENINFELSGKLKIENNK